MFGNLNLIRGETETGNDRDPIPIKFLSTIILGEIMGGTGEAILFHSLGFCKKQKHGNR